MTQSSEAQTPAEAQAPAEVQYGEELTGTIFPYIDNSHHWDIDYNDTNQSYEGSVLPPWILGGFAVYVLWSIIYLLVALS